MRSIAATIVRQEHLRHASRRRVLAARSRAGLYRRRSDEGLPLPPPHLRERVAGTPDADWFLESGRMAISSMAAALGDHGVQIEDRQAILDFGCGCGRVIRHLRSVPGDVHGTDSQTRLVRWCRRNLPFARFSTNEIAPPLPFASDSFDLVYALSVFTHLPSHLQRPWIEELTRVSQPGGLIAVTTHGEWYRRVLTEAEDARFAAGELVVRNATSAGENECAVFHPESWIREELAQGLDVLSTIPHGARGNPEQDIYVLAKPARNGTARAGA